MTGEQHYEEAQHLLEYAGDPMTSPANQQVLIGRAQVHAQLAAVHAQMIVATTNRPPAEAESIWRAWNEEL